MLKRLCLAFAGLFALASIAHGAGTVPGFSLTPQFDLSGTVAPGCRLYVYQAGTVATPQNAYSDSGLTQPLPNPMICDAGGRLGQFFLADGTIKLRLTKSNGTQIFVGDNLLVVGPSGGGGGGGGTVDPTTILATGDIKDVYGTGVLTGFVRANGRTIGSATSGATERANADTAALFSFLWGQDPNLVVSGGRGASAAADFAANKTIALPDFRSRVRAALSDMGNADSGLFGPTYCTTTTTLGFVCGGQTSTLTLAMLPTGITSSGTNTINVTSTQSGIASNANINTILVNSSGSLWMAGNTISAMPLGTVTSTGSNSISVTSNNTGGQPVRTVQPTMFVTTYIKL